MRRFVLAGALAVSIVVCGATTVGAQPPSIGQETTATADQDAVTLAAGAGERDLRSSQRSTVAVDLRLSELRRGVACQPPAPTGLQDQASTLTDTVLNGPCVTGA
ncbi:hypothetical protein, partial [Cellulomonas sp. URHD0024]|uniref:hypothetical protein n=1 Tax=Cellulomonas sp. URHD0024 TaxID=1302620 RepID=UPI001E4B9C7C